MQGVNCTALHCTAWLCSEITALTTQVLHLTHSIWNIWDNNEQNLRLRASLSTHIYIKGTDPFRSLHKNPLIWPTVHRGKIEKCEVVRVEWVVGNESFMCWDGPTLSGGRTRHWVPGLSCPPPLEVSHSQDRRKQLMKVQLSTTIPIQVNCKIIQIFEFPFV